MLLPSLVSISAGAVPPNFLGPKIRTIVPAGTVNKDIMGMSFCEIEKIAS